MRIKRSVREFYVIMQVYYPTGSTSSMQGHLCFLSLLYCIMAATSHWPLHTIHVELSINSSAQCCSTHNETIELLIEESTRKDSVNTLPQQQGTYVCPSLNEALFCLQKLGNSTLIYLPNDGYNLVKGKETEIVRMSHIAIVGESKEYVNISCTDESNNGFSFRHSTNITMQNFTIYGCSKLQNSTNRNYTFGIPFSYLTYRVSIYMLLCTDVSITDVIVSTSNGNGMTLYNVGGSVSLFRCSFIKNNHRPGGGGLLIEFSYCIPGDLSCSNSTSTQVAQNYSSNAKYTVRKCEFKGNIAFRGFRGLRKFTNIGKDSFSFGYGGGLSVVLKGNARFNWIVFSECYIADNIGHMGGGFYMSFHDDASNNTILFHNSVFKGNKIIEKNVKVFDVDGGGGGGKIIFDNGEHGGSSYNSVVIKGGNFSNNVAIMGGGLWIETNLNKGTVGSSVSVENCTFQNNTAFLGSGVYLSSGFKKVTVNVTFTNVDFLVNRPKCSQTIRNSFLPCSGILYSISIPFSINGSNSFLSNIASAIEVHETEMKVLPNTRIIFQLNESPYGSSIALYDCSFMELFNNTMLNFFDNHALNYGGAIYAGSCSGGSQPADASSECFVQYHNRTTHPNKWETSLTFHNNSDITGNNSLFAVSLSACWWPLENETFIYTDIYTHSNISKTFCWDTWHYHYNCSQEVSSGPAFISFKDEKFNIRPGDYIQIPEVRDGAFRMITNVTVLSACIEYGPASFAIGSQKRCEKHHPRLYFYNTGQETFHDNHTIRISISLNKERPGGSFEPGFDLQFENCSFPYKFNKYQCLYQFDYFCCDEDCEAKCGVGTTVTPKPQYCVANTSKGDFLIGHCPLSYNGLPKYDPHYDSINNLTEECAHGHQGTLCGDCKPHLGVPLNSLYYSCVDCSKSRVPGILLFILLELIPLSLMMCFIIVFNINLTAGGMIGFVFYCQMISLDFPVWVYPTWLAYSHDNPRKVLETSSSLNRFATVPYRIFNLDFLMLYDPIHLVPICISNHMNALEVIVFSYVTPLYCVFTLLLLMIVLVMYSRGVHCVVKITRPFHKCFARFWSFLKIRPSLMESLASIYILCFTPLAATSLKLLHFTTWQSLTVEHKAGKSFFYDAEYEYFGFPHAMFGLLAIFVLIFFCILPAVFLLLYPYRVFHKFLHLIKLRHQVLIAFADINTGSFCDGSRKSKDFRSFAGLYLLLRLAIMCFYYIPGQYSMVILYLETITSLVFGGVIMIFRPFKKAFVNFVNFMVFALLGIGSAVCLADGGREGRTVTLAFVIHIPLISAFLCFVYYIKKKCAQVMYKHYRKVKTPLLVNVGTTEYADNDTTVAVESNVRYTDIQSTDATNTEQWPDRVENPSEYDGDTSGVDECNKGNVRLLNASSDMYGGRKRGYGSVIIH